ncbi:MAG: SDR family NAD(P)-dependent oxidoreductase [Flavobacteriales bacterium]|nr:SDR family NAD(P)-dependent oxidoreductase [Flavobacteriales bacterium]
MKTFKEKYTDYALITGASSGIGKEFAEQLAQKGLNLVLVARRKDKLNELAIQLRKEYRVTVKTVALDLLQEDAIETLVAETDKLEIGLLIPNAGMEVHGDFLQNNYREESKVVQLNTLVPMQLAHVFGQKMTARKRGGIIFVSSTFGHQSVPYFANYSATKAYILSIGQALNYELKKSSVDVTVLSPGLTKTEMSGGMTDMDFGKMPIVEMQVAPVVKTAIEALGKKQAIIPGAINNVMDVMGKFATPRWINTNMFGFLVNRAMNRNIPRN